MLREYFTIQSSYVKHVFLIVKHGVQKRKKNLLKVNKNMLC
ncbi:hypothetical protein DCCM_0538 [Desulfocucumis palustris]|uniref:Uncharacterized protein n=1 Tax=Desulfocucumis palustris TaxID=1898651 RepID=A0A2L2X8V5_9FIRM|nr:hypothetical protein DCCM_0538 [Desulfocucumis palustris]